MKHFDQTFKTFNNIDNLPKKVDVDKSKLDWTDILLLRIFMCEDFWR